MSTTAADAATTCTVVTPHGRHDVVLGRAVTVADLLAAVDLPPTTTLVTAGGVVLGPTDDLERLAGGDVLVVATAPAPGRPAAGRTGEDRPGGTSPAAALWLVAGATAALALVRGAQLATDTADVALVPALAAGLLAVVLALVTRPTTARAATAATVATWTSAAAAGLLGVPAPLVEIDGVPALLVPVTVALLAAGAATALRYARVHGTPPAVEAGVLLAFTVVPAAAAVVTVMTGAPVPAAAAVLLGVAPIVARALPAGSLDVPDHVVVDLSAAQRTATAVREKPVVSPAFVRASTVRRTITTAQTRRTWAAVLLGVLVAAAAPLVLLAPPPATTSWPGHVQLWATGALGVAVAGALVLIPRQERLTAARLGPRLAAAVTGLLTVVWFTRVLDGGTATLIAVGALLAALLTVTCAFALGRGWRSVRWSRTADNLESLAVAFAPALALLAAGVLAGVRLLASG
ncbi:hypothetical protein [Serinibacter arcticus]|uniref:hypothetical protein n=1 Tax=Serinibacter arcticus TaxID=1655435 RepID=UPI001304F34A|nr:hypothetical protein [Serinibacter arcticus]